MDSNKLNLTMLYVEDEKDTRDKLAEVFRLKVATVYVAKNGSEALELFNKHHINLVVSDFQMPIMDGIKLCNEVKKIHKQTYFVLLTAFNDSELLISAIDANVDKFLKKPIDAKKLFETLDDIYLKIMNEFNLEKSTVCLQEAEKIANLSYWDVDLSIKNIHFSKEIYELFGLEQVYSYKQLENVVNVEYKVKFLEIFEKRVFEDNSIDEVISINKGSKTIYLRVAAKRWKSSVCGKWHLIGIFQDITHFELQRLELLKENQCDPMLKISNKKFIVNQLENLIKSAKRYGHPIGVIFFDIDDFKGINDTHGHLVADCILIQLAKLIQSNIRQSDYFGRWGGDEFVIINTHASPDSVIILIKKLLNKVNEFIWEKNVSLKISAGVAFYEAGDDVKSILDRADKKMLEAKQHGKNMYMY